MKYKVIFKIFVRIKTFKMFETYLFTFDCFEIACDGVSVNN